MPTLVWKQTHMRVHLPMTIQALPGAIGPLPNIPFIPSETSRGRSSEVKRIALSADSDPNAPGGTKRATSAVSIWQNSERGDAGSRAAGSRGIVQYSMVCIYIYIYTY